MELILSNQEHASSHEVFQNNINLRYIIMINREAGFLRKIN